MAALSLGLILTAGFARATQDEDTVSALASASRVDAVGHTMTGALLTPLLHAMATRRARGGHPATATSRHDVAASQLANSWVSSPPVPLAPFSP